MKLLAGNSNYQLSEKLANLLDISLIRRDINYFNDREIFVEILENIKGEDVFVIQSTAPPANDNLMELLITIDTLRRSSVRTISAIIPYFGYARQDRRTGAQTPISAKLVANLITAAGANRVLTVDLHTAQIQGFFDIPIDNLLVTTLFTQDILDKFGRENIQKNIMIIAPDIGCIQRARAIATQLNCDMGIIDKCRESPGVSHVMNIIGNVKDKICIFVDDIIDSGCTICNAAAAVMDNGAKSTYAYLTHGVFSKGMEHITRSQITEFVVTDSINMAQDIVNHPKVRILSLAPILAEEIKNTQ